MKEFKHIKRFNERFDDDFDQEDGSEWLPEAVCPDCDGEGMIHGEVCDSCNGEGIVDRPDDIPPY